MSFNDSEIRDVEAIEEQEGIKIQEFIRALIKDKARSLRKSKIE